jgi:hypothetical protein
VALNRHCSDLFGVEVYQSVGIAKEVLTVCECITVLRYIYTACLFQNVFGSIPVITIHPKNNNNKVFVIIVTADHLKAGVEPTHRTFCSSFTI